MENNIYIKNQIAKLPEVYYNKLLLNGINYLCVKNINIKKIKLSDAIYCYYWGMEEYWNELFELVKLIEKLNEH